MRITYLLLFISLVQAHANLYSQGNKITLEVKNIAVEDVFSEIEKITDFKFLYNVNNINLQRKISINVHKEKMQKVLYRMFKGTNIDFVILDRQIVLKPKAKNNITSRVPISKPKKTEQQREISGYVIDKYREPLVGVSVLVKGTQRGVATDFDGAYKLKVSKGETLIFSYLGYLDKEVLVTDETIYDVILTSTSLELESVDIFYTGYQQIEKERATGSFERVEQQTLSAKVEQNILAKIEGEVTGLVVDSESGNFIIRGLSSINANTQPLVVVDGFAIEGDISTINPNDVESISILKDAAAASIWGIRATNGVIVIVTKKGKRSGKLKIDASVNTSYTSKPNLLKNGFGSATTQIAHQRALFNRGGDFFPDQLFSGDLNQNSLPQLNPVIETLLQESEGIITAAEAEARLQQLANSDVRKEYSDLILRPVTWNQYNVAISGGGEKHDFRTSVSYNTNEDGFVGVNSEQFITNFTNSFDLTSKLKLRTSINYTSSRSNLNPNDTDDILTPFVPSTDISNFVISSRILDNNGNYIPSSAGFNPLSSQLALENGFAYDWTHNVKQEYDNANNVDRGTALRLQAGLEYELFKNFKVNLNYQYEWAHSKLRNLYNENTFTTRNRVNTFTQIDALGNATSTPIPAGSILDETFFTDRSHTVRTQINYDADLNDNLHQITALAGYEVRKNIREGSSSRRYGFNDQALISTRPDFTTSFNLPLNNLVSPALIPDNLLQNGFNNNYVENRFVSYYANVAYTFDDTYTVSASTRLDDTNLFGASDKFRNIPLYSVGLKWNITNDLLYDSDAINLLELRATYGINGNVDRNTSPFLQAVFARNNPPFNNLSTVLSSAPNPELRLEKTRTVNLGVDFGLFDNLITGSVEYYKKNSEDLLANRLINPTLGVNTLLLNIGELSNEGVDISLDLVVAERENFSYTTSGKFSLNENKLTKVDLTETNVRDFTLGNSAILGNPLRTIYSFNFAGLDRNGDPQFLDENGDIVDFRTDIQSVDALVKEGTIVPRYYGSWINDLSYKNLSLRILTTFKAGHVFRYYDFSSGTSFSYIPGGQINVPEDFNNRWQNPGDENFTDIPAVPSFNNSFALGYSNLAFSDKFVDTAAHIRLQQISLGYSFPQALTKKLSMDSFSMSLQADNVAVWSFNKWNIDPENLSFPVPSTFTFNITASF